ncbi:hypothetical protein EST38_g14035 [Candolleomyces aberdarensis]|uniref:Uncharacterized protein n=1 Tax=Candolleomyces aberdarensis TaxID=2316362 RepID=A0A4Q2CYB6_9AGAR|nr:hypothetical protein EST38_g14035 [Candolleomyces aberdarensis]
MPYRPRQNKDTGPYPPPLEAGKRTIDGNTEYWCACERWCAGTLVKVSKSTYYEHKKGRGRVTRAGPSSSSTMAGPSNTQATISDGSSHSGGLDDGGGNNFGGDPMDQEMGNGGAGSAEGIQENPPLRHTNALFDSNTDAAQLFQEHTEELLSGETEDNSPHTGMAHLDSLRTALEFIDALRQARHSDTDIFPNELVEGLDNPLQALLNVDNDRFLRLSLDLFLLTVNGAESQYNMARDAILRCYPDPDSAEKILTFPKCKDVVRQLTGVVPIVNDMCPNSCMAYTGPFSDRISCGVCGESRYQNTPGRKKLVPKQKFYTIPIGPIIQALWSSPDNARHMGYRKRKTAEILERFRSANGTLEVMEYDDFFCGSEYLEAVISGKIQSDDVVLVTSVDGAQLFEHKASDCWLYIWIIMDLPPDIRYKKQYLIPGGVIPGPKKPKNFDSYMFPGLAHVNSMQKDGLKEAVAAALATADHKTLVNANNKAHMDLNNKYSDAKKKIKEAQKRIKELEQEKEKNVTETLLAKLSFTLNRFEELAEDIREHAHCSNGAAPLSSGTGARYSPPVPPSDNEDRERMFWDEKSWKAKTASGVSGGSSLLHKKSEDGVPGFLVDVLEAGIISKERWRQMWKKFGGLMKDELTKHPEEVRTTWCAHGDALVTRVCAAMYQAFPELPSGGDWKFGQVATKVYPSLSFIPRDGDDNSPAVKLENQAGLALVSMPQLKQRKGKKRKGRDSVDLGGGNAAAASAGEIAVKKAKTVVPPNTSTVPVSTTPVPAPTAQPSPPATEIRTQPGSSQPTPGIVAHPSGHTFSSSPSLPARPPSSGPYQTPAALKSAYHGLHPDPQWTPVNLPRSSPDVTDTDSVRATSQRTARHDSPRGTPSSGHYIPDFDEMSTPIPPHEALNPRYNGVRPGHPYPAVELPRSEEDKTDTDSSRPTSQRTTRNSSPTSSSFSLSRNRLSTVLSQRSISFNIPHSLANLASRPPSVGPSDVRARLGLFSSTSSFGSATPPVDATLDAQPALSAPPVVPAPLITAAFSAPVVSAPHVNASELVNVAADSIDGSGNVAITTASGVCATTIVALSSCLQPSTTSPLAGAPAASLQLPSTTLLTAGTTAFSPQRPLTSQIVNSGINAAASLFPSLSAGYSSASSFLASGSIGGVDPDKENISNGRKAPGEGIFRPGKKNTGKGLFGHAWYAKNKGRQTKDFNAAWNELPPAEQEAWNNKAKHLSSPTQQAGTAQPSTTT